MDCEAKSTHLEINLLLKKIVFIIQIELNNYLEFNILFISRTKVLTSGRKSNGNVKAMDVELNA